MPLCPAAAQSRPAAPDAFRGLADTLEFRAPGPLLRATANQSRVSPILVRIAEARPGQNRDVAYRVEFMGLVAGEYDLRDYLERQDGSPLDLPPLPVSVRSKLAAGHGTDLFSSPRLPPLVVVRYRVVMMVLAGLWLGVPVVYVVVRLIRRRPVPPAPIVLPPPSLAEQLRPLADAAIRGSLSLAERGRLELLMYLYWREQLALEGPAAEVVPRLRRDARAGRLLRAVEGWLHSGRSRSTRAEDEVALLLEPYRGVPAIAEDALAPPATKSSPLVEHAR